MQNNNNKNPSRFWYLRLPTIILLLDDQGMQVWKVAGKWRAPAHFSLLAECQQPHQLLDILKNSTARVILLVDSNAEAFQIEQLPRTSGRDQRAMLQHKLQQQFGEQAWSVAWPQPQLDALPGRQLVVMAALFPVQLNWLQALSGIRLQAAYHVSQLLPQLTSNDQTRLFVCRSPKHAEENAQQPSWRLSVVAQRQLLFSRKVSAELPQEIQKVRQHLHSRKALWISEPCPTTLIGNEADLEKYAPIINSDPMATLETTCIDNLAEFYLRLLLADLPAIQFAPASLRLPALVFSYRKWLRNLSLATISLSLVYAAIFWHKGQASLQRSQAMQAQATKLETKSEKSLPPHPSLTSKQIRQLNQQISNIKTLAEISPFNCLAFLSQVMDEFPQANLQTLQWRLLTGLTDAQGQVVKTTPPFSELQTQGTWQIGQDDFASFVSRLDKPSDNCTLVAHDVSEEVSRTDELIKFSLRLQQ